MKRFKTLWILIIMTLLFTGCSTVSDMSTEIENFYIEYLEAWKSGNEDVVKYRYHVDKASEEFYKESVAWDKLYSYEVYSFEQLNESLWVVYVSTKSVATPNGYNYYNFIGLFDGGFLVIGNYTQVPNEMRGNLDLSIYGDPNVIYE